MQTIEGKDIILLSDTSENIEEILMRNRQIRVEDREIFFAPSLTRLHDPYLLPDMDRAVGRIIEAKKKHERIIIFGDYDVDGVSSTALLVRFLREIGCQVSYRLPHRVHDGYGLKSYFFDELAQKDVKLVITVDCGTRDIEPIRHAKTLGIDVIITDHHAVPDTIPDEVIALINPKRKDSIYPFRELAGAGVAFKLLHALVRELYEAWSVHEILKEYIDFAALGTVSDCMPIIGENRIITSLGLRQMHWSRSIWLRKFLEWRENIRENDADLIGFQIGPRINAAGRMDTPLTALRWLLASEDRCDVLFDELEHWNESRREATGNQFEKALLHIDTTKPVIIYDADDLDHGIIWLVAGKLTEMYGKPAIVIKNGHDHPLTRRKWDEVEIEEGPIDNLENLSIASCRSPEWCNIIDLLESCREYFIRFGGHRQAAGFTIETSRLPDFREALYRAFANIHDINNLPKRTLEVECRLHDEDITLETVDIIDRFRPFGIGNRKPLFLLQNETLVDVSPLGKDGRHLQLHITSMPWQKLVIWNPSELVRSHLITGNILSFIIELDRNEWNGKQSVNVVIKDIAVEG